mmetsp:Transcript_1549/g.2284  ORF Transcript_1549/g.2284 Transcript_1549/m.2284 type:complete len:96 (+) Transcript_1549:33-320(+)|eukprot:CAMPEP_0194206682 /NCGR_PEP_ID=MMETSP0156-20130528/5637_1 /TAXON_ID=33649 /ORGANISM="Thalassionema nitzschioides, Strain L26-B" /LENGTH=95 /DNA_ID=CAMNT_0038933255 /DNA_START=69 /DNA_END=356 /DNA_ORIENTATION=-
MINKVLSFLFLVLLASTDAFTVGPNVRIVSQQQRVSDMPSYAQSSSSLNLKVKVDPDAKNNNAKGNAKAAAYGGSIAIAALLPIAFLIWSAVSHP